MKAMILRGVLVLFTTFVQTFQSSKFVYILVYPYHLTSDVCKIKKSISSNFIAVSEKERRREKESQGTVFKQSIFAVFVGEYSEMHVPVLMDFSGLRSGDQQVQKIGSLNRD